MAKQNHSCFCKSCVPSPACELQKVITENKRIINQNKDLQRTIKVLNASIDIKDQLLEAYRIDRDVKEQEIVDLTERLNNAKNS